VEPYLVMRFSDARYRGKIDPVERYVVSNATGTKRAVLLGEYGNYQEGPAAAGIVVSQTKGNRRQEGTEESTPRHGRKRGIIHGCTAPYRGEESVTTLL
jgi:hypothetical protein